MPLDRENGELFTPPPTQPEQPAATPRPEQQQRPVAPQHGLPSLPPGLGMRPPAPARAPLPQPQNTQPLFDDRPSHYNSRDRYESSGAGTRTSRRARVILIGGMVATVFGGGAAVGDTLFFHGSHVDAVMKRITDLLPKDNSFQADAPKHHTYPTQSEEAMTPSEEPTTEPTIPSTTTTTPAPTQKPTPTSKPTQNKLVVPPTAEGCVQSLPLDIKVGQLVESTIDANSDTAELKKIALKYHLGSWLILKYPTQVDGQTPDVNAIAELKRVDKNLPALMVIDGEGGAINRLPGATVPMSPDKVSATKPAPATLEAQLQTYYKQLKNAGVDVNLAPVADINTTNISAFGRLFRTPADAAKYMPTYTAAAKTTGLPLTFKHFPQVLEYGNTDLKPVTTPSYDVLQKSGVLDSYKLVNGTDNWVMMGSATTRGFPNKNLDNGQIAVFNPAAYDAAKQLTGDALFITDALNAKAVTGITSQAEAAAKAINAGADIAMIVPRDGKATADTVAALNAIEQNVSKARINEAFIKVLAAKAVNPCVLLAAEDTRYAAPQPTSINGAQKPATTATAPIIFPSMSSPLSATEQPKKATTPTVKPTVAVAAKP